MQRTALELEKQERPILEKTRVILATRPTNTAILLKRALDYAILLKQLPSEKLIEYHTYPLFFQLGFIHSIPENEFDISSATITDVGFLGLFPKPLLQILNHYTRKMEKDNQACSDSSEFKILIDILITAFIYRPITLQKIIKMLIASMKQKLTAAEKRLDDDQNTNATDTNADNLSTHRPIIQSPPSTVQPLLRVCHAYKCRILKAKGILRRNMFCTNNKNMCSGCINESSRHSKTLRLEEALLSDNSSNSTLAPLLAMIETGTTLKQIRSIYQHIPIFATKKRDDHLSGATRYLTHTMGFHMTDSISHDIIDAPLQMTKRFDIWPQAKFHCKCCPNITNVEQTSFGNRGFCKRCSFLVYRTNISHVTRCPGCDINDSWETIGHPCLACQVATIVHRNPFQARYEAQIQLWLNQENSDSDSSSSELETPSRPTPSKTFLSEHEMLEQRNASIERSFSEIKSRTSPQESKYIFENLSILRNDIQNSCSDNLKRDFTSQESTAV